MEISLNFSSAALVPGLMSGEVIFTREFSVRVADLFCAGRALYVQDFVVVPFVHPQERGTPNLACQPRTELDKSGKRT